MQQLVKFWNSGRVGKIVLGTAGVLALLAICCVYGTIVGPPRNRQTAGQTTAQVTAPASAEAETPIVDTEPGATEAPPATEAPTEPPATEGPTSAPEPTIEPTIEPTPESTAVPTSAPAPAESGGIGLTREQWEAAHGAGTEDPLLGVNYENGAYNVLFQPDPSGVDTVWILEQRFGREGISVEDARTISKLLLPDDSELVETYTPTEGRLADLYMSEWLKGRFEADMFNNGEPGNFTVLYRVATGRVTSILLGPGRE
jgi:hypothetical protein